MYKLLVVDDEPLMREYMKINIPLIDSNWQVTGEASDGKEAIEFIENQRVDLIITDIKMPVMDGLELCKIISQRYPKQKIIIFSGYDDFSYAKEAILYGVTEYLLKPIVKDNLKSALDNVNQKIEKEKSTELTYRNLINLSKDSKDRVIKKFLQTLVYEVEAEIKTLYPLVYRMKVNLMEGEGMILLLSLDEEMLLQKDIPVSDISIYRYILSQATTEMVEENNMGWVFLDSNENTCILITGEEVVRVQQSCIDLAAKVCSFMYENTGMTITASVGHPVNDLLQLNLSYKSADKLLTCSLIPQKNQVYTYNDPNITTKLILVEEIISISTKLKSGFLDRNEMIYYLALSSLASQIDCLNIQSILRCGIYIIKDILSLKTDISSEFIENAMKLLKDFSTNFKSDLTKENVIQLYKEVMVSLYGDPTRDERMVMNESRINEESIVNKSKEYIYAHYSEPISLGLIAENVGISSSYLSQLFHKAVGESYIQFLTKVRMEQAAKLLRAYPNERITQICEKVGYLGVKHFSYVFKQYFNMTPGEYQNK